MDVLEWYEELKILILHFSEIRFENSSLEKSSTMLRFLACRLFFFITIVTRVIFFSIRKMPVSSLREARNDCG